MFPNPQDALPLPPRPDLEHYRRLAKDLLADGRSTDPAALGHWATGWLRRLERLLDPPPASGLQRLATELETFARRRLGDRGTLAGAQLVLARSHGFASWPRFVRHLEGLGGTTSAISHFEAAADAVVHGDTTALARLLGAHPELIHARSTREHGATLLHYVSANGVENFRQRTPVNAGEVARLLLSAGAEVEAEANVYGGGATTLGLTATSIHPERAGVQLELLALLLDHGAAIDRPEAAGNRHSTVKGCLANGRALAAEYLAGRGARLDLETAAGVGWLEAVARCFDAEGRLRAPSTPALRDAGFRWACLYGRIEVVDHLLDRGADLATAGADGQTGLHLAVLGGQLEMVRRLLARGAPLEPRNVYGGTVLETAIWSALHADDGRDLLPIFDALLAAGARVPPRHPPIDPRVDALLARHGGRADRHLGW